MPYRPPNTAALDHLKPESIRIHEETERPKSLRSIARRRSVRILNLDTQRRRPKTPGTPQHSSARPSKTKPERNEVDSVESSEGWEPTTPQGSPPKASRFPQEEPKTPYSPMDLTTPPPTWTEKAYNRVTFLFSPTRAPPTRAPPTRMELAQALMLDRKKSTDVATQRDINKVMHSMRMRFDTQCRHRFFIWNCGHMAVRAIRTAYSFLVNDPYRSLRYHLFWTTFKALLVWVVGGGLLFGTAVWMGLYQEKHGCVWKGPLFGWHDHCLRRLILPRIGLLSANRAYDFMEVLMEADPYGDLPAEKQVPIVIWIVVRRVVVGFYRWYRDLGAIVIERLWKEKPLWARFR